VRERDKRTGASLQNLDAGYDEEETGDVREFRNTVAHYI
jgi:hypothetical protein